jgi:hypothetical protein
MQNASNHMWGILGRERVAQLISRHGPECILFSHFLSVIFSMYFYFLFLPPEAWALLAAKTTMNL